MTGPLIGLAAAAALLGMPSQRTDRRGILSEIYGGDLPPELFLEPVVVRQRQPPRPSGKDRSKEKARRKASIATRRRNRK